MPRICGNRKPKIIKSNWQNTAEKSIKYSRELAETFENNR